MFWSLLLFAGCSFRGDSVGKGALGSGQAVNPQDKRVVRGAVALIPLPGWDQCHSHHVAFSILPPVA